MNKLFNSKRTPIIHQTEAAECGLACLAMVAGWHGHDVDLATLRSRYSISLKGATLADLMRLAGCLNLAPRPLRLDLEHLRDLKLPCILHWDFNHFVVLTQVRGNRIVLHDPAAGRRELPLAEFSRHFTGVALELAPTPTFVAKTEKRKVSLLSLVGRLHGAGAILIQVVILAIVLQVFAIIGPFYMQWIVDQALVARDNDLVAVLGVGFLLLALVQAGITGLRAWLLLILGTGLNLQMQSNLFRHLIRLPMGWFDKRHVGDVVSRFQSLEAIQRTLTTASLEALIDGVMAVVTLVMMFFYSAKLALVALVAAVLYGGLRIALYRAQRNASEEAIIKGAKQNSHFLESVRGIQSIKLFARENQRAASWQNLAVAQFNASNRVQRLTILYQGLESTLFGIENAVTIWLGALLVLDMAQGAGFSVGMLFAFVAYKTQFVQRIGSLVGKVMDMRMLGLHTERAADIALEPAEPVGQAMAIESQPVSGAIEVKGLSYRYADTEPLVLDNLDLRIEEGESVAIVGPSGCGKTTLIKLMLGLLQPIEGNISVGGLQMRHLGLARYRSMVASVMQDDQLLAGSIAENICFFDPQPDFGLIEESARMAAIHDEIVTMPMQYNTLVGDMGTVLSGGQKQRILLARALYRRPKILFLDEATSHLDVVRERCVNEAVRNLRLTRIIVAHRPETIAMAGRVISLHNGRASGELHQISAVM